MHSDAPKIVETESFARIARLGQIPKILPLLPKGCYLEPEFEIWKELTGLARQRKRWILHQWIHFREKLAKREASALKLWAQIKEKKMKEWEKVWIIPSESVISLFTILEGKIIGRLAWRRKK